MNIVFQTAGLGLPESTAKQVAKTCAPATYKIIAQSHAQVYESWGSAFLTPDGMVTAKHVIAPILIQGTANIPVWASITASPLLDISKVYTTTPKSVSKDYDVAVLNPVSGSLQLNWGKADNLKIGEPVLVLSAPNTSDTPLLPYASLGQVTALSTESPATFEYTIPVKPGSSGGVVLNMQGEAVGVNVMRLASELGSARGVGIKAEAVQAALAGKEYTPPTTVIMSRTFLTSGGIMIGAAGLLLLTNLIKR